jgi:hypothetical protein
MITEVGAWIRERTAQLQAARPSGARRIWCHPLQTTAPAQDGEMGREQHKFPNRWLRLAPMPTPFQKLKPVPQRDLPTAA